MQNLKFFITGFCFFLFTGSIFGQTSQVEFGKNRVQFHEDFKEWAMYESENFVTYWYGEGRAIGQSVVQMAETDFMDIQRILEHRMNDKIDIIVYKDLTDIKQSNIGSEEVFFNTGGKTKIVGNKIFVYFDGNHNNLRRSVREGVASAYLNAMMFGANLQEIVQNAVLLNLPQWFKDGLVSYAGESWNVHYDDRMREIFLLERYEKFEDFADEYPKLAGHSMWYFISQNYGKSVVPNLLYLTRINRSIESGYASVLGDTYESSLTNWYEFYNKRYRTEIKGFEKPKGKKVKIKNRRKLPISNLKLSPDGKKVAYVLNEIGKVKVFIQDIRTGERTQILKYGSRNPFQETDYNYPLLAWSPNNLELGIIYEQRDIIKIIQRDLNTGKHLEDVLPNQFHRINSMDYINPFKMVFSATVGGVSDIFTFIPKTRQSIRLTQDFWDDLDAKFVKIDGQKGILFSSNRIDTLLVTAKLDSILPINTFDIFYYDLENPSKELTRVTNTPYTNERNPVGVDTTWFSYISEASGIYNQNMGYLETYLAWNNQAIYLSDGSEIIIREDSIWNNVDSIAIDSVVIQPVYKKRGVTHNRTNYPSHLIRHDIAGKVNKQIILHKEGHTYQMYVQPIDTLTVVQPRTTIFRKQALNEAGLKLTQHQNTSGNVKPPTQKLPKKEDKIIEDYLFQSEFDEAEKPPMISIDEEDGNIVIEPSLSVPSSPSWDEAQVHEFRQERIVPYQLQFRTDFITTTVDNSLLFGGLNNYAGTGQESNFPPPGILLKANFKDLFEDYVLEGGIRIPTTFNGAEYYLFLDNKKKRLDKRFAAYRRSRRRNGLDIAPIAQQPQTRFVEPRNRETTFLTQLELRYPFDIFRSLRATTTFRIDKQTQLSTDQSALNTATGKQQRLGLRLEYVFDNTLDVDINIKNGTRYKFYGEVLKRFEIDFIDGFNFDLGEGFMTILGFDARHYQRLDKHSVLAVRAAGSTSFGSERILFLLGGVDNWLFPSFNQDIPLPSNEGLAYQTFANNVRGFKTNIRNGTSYALINTELRIPIFKYFSRRIKSSFFRSFQLVGFFDIGTAWEGLSPYSDDNPLNITTVTNGAVTLSINYFRDPIVMGYGAGVRAMLFGYFLKLDYAWGIESRVTQDPRLHFSIGMDF